MDYARALVLCVVVIAGECYENKLTKLWSMSSVTPERTVVNVESDTYIVPDGYSASEPLVYSFKPRSMPKDETASQVERTARYSEIQSPGQFKTEVLFPGSYFQIADAKKNASKYDPLARAPFTPKIIPLRGGYGKRRSLDGDYEETREVQPVAMRRSIGYFDDIEDIDGKDDEEEEEEEELEEGEGEVDSEGKRRRPRIKRKYMRYMLPLLLAYKLKFFTLIPLLMGGLVLLTGATGMAGFFFALFAAVMGLSKTTGQ